MKNYTKHRIKDHEGFLFDQLLPLLVGYARTSNTPSAVVASALDDRRATTKPGA